MIAWDQRFTFPERNYDVLTVGEILIDLIATDYEEDENHAAMKYECFFGGSPANIAMNTQKLGIRSLVAAAVGQDSFGDYLIEQLRQASMDTSCVQQVEASTSLVVLTKSKSTPIPIFYRGADSQLNYTVELEQAVAQSRIVHFSCWPISAYPVRETIERVIAEARKHQALVCFDPNYHPMVWQAQDDAFSYIKLLIGQVDIIKPSEDDAARLFGPDTPANQVKRFLDLGAKLVILTLGKDGAIVSNGTQMLTFPTLATDIVDTTGAGDAFWSGFYTGIIQGLTCREALQLGFAVSAFKLKHLGAVIDLPNYQVIREMYGA